MAAKAGGPGGGWVMLLLSEADVRQVLTMDQALAAVEAGFRSLALDEAVNVPRARAQTDHVMLHTLAAASKTLGYLGYKAYTTTRKGARFHVGLHDGKTGALLALIEADYLGQVRTGAASGLATRLLARPDAKTAGVFGAGKQARTQLLAVARVRPLTHAVVYSPTSDRRETFARELAAELGIPVEPVAEPRLAAEGRDVVITATTSRTPVLQGDWLSQGTHVNVIGSNFLSKAEIDVNVVRRCDVVVVDSKDQCRIEAGDFSQALEEGVIHWADMAELPQLLIGRRTGRQGPDEITLFKSVGLGIEDVAVAGVVYEQARAAGLGQEVTW
jgi:ornithine cyclodeaminase/alanine dehydrogenase-like protein (mu-crystallin family)